MTRAGFRPDEDAERALAVLTADGTAVSSAVRGALIDAARARAQQRLSARAASFRPQILFDRVTTRVLVERTAAVDPPASVNTSDTSATTNFNASMQPCE